MDALTKVHWHHKVDCQAAPQQKIEDECWQVWFRDWKVAMNMVAYHACYCTGLAMLKYWAKWGKFPPSMSLEIDWGVVDRAMAGVGEAMWRWCSKHNVGMCGVGKWMARWQQWLHQVCPHCRQLEDARHVIWCLKATKA